MTSKTCVDFSFWMYPSGKDILMPPHNPSALQMRLCGFFIFMISEVKGTIRIDIFKEDILWNKLYMKEKPISCQLLLFIHGSTSGWYCQ